MNVLSKQLHNYGNIPIKACREIRFSHGGHLFAAAYGNNSTYVYNFYTRENPPHFQCKGHIQKVRSVDWIHHDMGFVSGCNGGAVYFWDLIDSKEGS